MKRDEELVSASAIASRSWCPESRRPRSLGHKPSNRAAPYRGGEFYARTEAFEGRSRSAISLGEWLLSFTSPLMLSRSRAANGPIPRPKASANRTLHQRACVSVGLAQAALPFGLAR